MITPKRKKKPVKRMARRKKTPALTSATVVAVVKALVEAYNLLKPFIANRKKTKAKKAATKKGVSHAHKPTNNGNK